MIRPAWGRYSCKHWNIHCSLLVQNCVALNVQLVAFFRAWRKELHFEQAWPWDKCLSNNACFGGFLVMLFLLFSFQMTCPVPCSLGKWQRNVTCPGRKSNGTIFEPWFFRVLTALNSIARSCMVSVEKNCLLANFCKMK